MMVPDPFEDRVQSLMGVSEIHINVRHVGYPCVPIEFIARKHAPTLLPAFEKTVCIRLVVTRLIVIHIHTEDLNVNEFLISVSSESCVDSIYTRIGEVFKLQSVWCVCT